MKYFYCEQCLYKTVRKHNLKRHVLKMHTVSKRVLECCGIVFQTKSHFRDHLSSLHKNGYICSTCQRSFRRKALLVRHLTVHGGRKEFRCSTCNYETSHKSNLYRHKKIHSKNKNLSFSNYKWVGDVSDVVNKAGYSTQGIPSEILNFISPYSSSTNLVSDMHISGHFPWYFGHKNVTGSTLYWTSMGIPRYSTPSFPLIRSDNFRDAQYFRPVAGFKPTTNAWYPVSCNELMCSTCHPEIGCSSDFYFGFENRRKITNENCEKFEPSAGEGIEITSSVRERPIRLCDFPYKCNFCGSRFGSQNELSHHYTLCDSKV